MAMKPKLSRPRTSRTTNQVLSSSRDGVDDRADPGDELADPAADDPEHPEKRQTERGRRQRGRAGSR